MKMKGESPKKASHIVAQAVSSFLVATNTQDNVITRGDNKLAKQLGWMMKHIQNPEGTLVLISLSSEYT